MSAFNPPVIGHRFAAAMAPENTLLACELAAKSGVKWVEFDVMLAACGTPIVFHDNNTRRVTGQAGRIKHLTYDALKSLEVRRVAGPETDQIPTLHAVLESCARLNLAMNVEIKPVRGQETKTARVVWQMVQDLWPNDQVPPLYSSFSIQSLHVIRQNDSSARLGLLMDRWRRGKIKQARGLDCQSIHCHQRIVTPQRVDFLRRLGFEVLVYTVNSREEGVQLLEQGVDAIFSDNPQVLA